MNAKRCNTFKFEQTVFEVELEIESDNSDLSDLKEYRV